MEPNSGTRAIMPQGDHELMAGRFLAETGGDDGNGERDHADTEKHHHPAEHLAQRRYRHDVTITDGGQRGERSPGGLRNRAELAWLHMAFDQIQAGRREQQQYQNDEKPAEQRPVFIGNDPAERLQRRRVAHEHEEAAEPEHPKQAQIQRIQPVQIPGQKRGSLACQRGSRLSIGISTALHILKAYSTVNTITENAANSQQYRPASSATVSAANAMALRKIRTMMKPLTRPIGWASPPTSSTS